MSNSKGNSSSNFSKPPAGDAKSGSSHIEPSGGVFARGCQQLPLSPFGDYIFKGIKERANEAGVFVPLKVAFNFANDYASKQSKRKNRDFSDADVAEAVRIFEEQYEPPAPPAFGGGAAAGSLILSFIGAIFSAICTWRPSAGHFIPDPIVQEFATTYASEHPPRGKKKFNQSEVDCALQLFRERQEQWLQQREHERQQREQQLQQEQQEQEQRRQQQEQQQHPQKPKPKKIVIQAGSLLAVPASKSKKCPKDNGVPMAISGEMEYARVLRMVGDRRFYVEILSSGILVLCRLAGAMPRGRDNRVNLEDVVLVDMRTYESTSTVQQPGGTIVFKYTPQEIRTLQKMGELSERCSSQLETSSVCFVRAKNFDEVVANVQGGYDWDFPPSDSEDDE
jgi:translation initiation factor IF-1